MAYLREIGHHAETSEGLAQCTAPGSGILQIHAKYSRRRQNNDTKYYVKSRNERKHHKRNNDVSITYRNGVLCRFHKSILYFFGIKYDIVGPELSHVFRSHFNSILYCCNLVRVRRGKIFHCLGFTVIKSVKKEKVGKFGLQCLLRNRSGSVRTANRLEYGPKNSTNVNVRRSKLSK